MQMCAFIDPRMPATPLVSQAQARMISNYAPFLEALKTQKAVGKLLLLLLLFSFTTNISSDR